MSDLTCPHCHETVPRGATVCRGCQAEVEYGPSSMATFVIFTGSVVVGAWIADMFPRSFGILKYVIFFGAIAGGVWLRRVLFGDRIMFKRNYRTR